MASYFATGSSRGIGLGIVQALAQAPAADVGKVFASARTETPALKKLVSDSAGRVEFISVDVTSEQSVRKAVQIVERSLDGQALDVLINNAGIMNHTPDGVENMTDLIETFNINVVGVHNATSSFLPLLKKGNLKKVINISSTLGSMTMSSEFMSQQNPAYKVSKAALNMLTLQYAHSHQSEGLTFVAICPGWVKTDLGSDAAHLTVDESVKGVLDIADRVTVADTGKFFVVDVPGWEYQGRDLYDGSERPW